jgi:hypothetical protein
MTEVLEQVSKYKENRENLKAISVSLKPLIQSGAFETINKALINMYSNNGNEEFKTFNQWKTEGKQIVKGSKAFTVWGKPKKAQNINEEKDFEEFDYYPICYLFSNLQVK